MNILKSIFLNLKENGLGFTVKKIIFNLYLKISITTKKNYHLKSLIARYEKLIQDANTIEEIYEAIQKFQFLSIFIRPLQVKSEILGLLKKIEELSPSTILEIGTNNGGTLALFANVISKSALLISIDLPGGSFGGGYPAWKIPFYKSFARKEQSIELIRADSHQKSTLDELSKILNGKPIDFLFIDGDHTYEGVKKDFEMYSPLVRAGGLIAFHDVAPHPPEKNVNIDKYIKELENQYSVEYLIENTEQGSCGIAYLQK